MPDCYIVSVCLWFFRCVIGFSKSFRMGRGLGILLFYALVRQSMIMGPILLFLLVKFMVLVHVLCLATEGFHTPLMMLRCDCILLLEYGGLTVVGAGSYHGVAAIVAYMVGRIKALM